jgi:hypothetical protein
MPRRPSKVNTDLLNAARTARAELFALKLSEHAHKVSGRYTDAWERLDRAIRAAEEEIEREKDED